MKESAFQRKFLKEVKKIFPEAIIMKNDSSYLQGISDFTILFPNGKWALLEFKKSSNSNVQPNQEYYVEKAKTCSYGAFVSPENEEVILNEIQESFFS